MSKSRKVATVATKEKKYPTEKLLKSRHLQGYQRDFAKVILVEPSYTVAEAREALDAVLKGGS